MGAETGRTAFILTLNSNQAAAGYRHQHTDRRGKKRNIPQIIKHRQHSVSLLYMISLMDRTLFNSEIAAIIRA
jgi:hypothetical protein